MKITTLCFTASLLFLPGCAAREKAPERASNTQQANCCLIQIHNTLATEVELDYSEFSVNHASDPTQQNHSQTGSLALKNEKIAPGKQFKDNLSKGTQLKIRFRMPGQTQMREETIPIADFLLITIGAEGLKTESLPAAKRPLLAL
ncbi:MAG: hypothetical protein IV090_13360 [Candidatus Sericytochromatia bacterium]|nr:hypothetical protein [Candidatus Sericytochromatia bacterium]